MADEIGELAGSQTDGAADRALGAFIGLAVGDALGTTLEFQRRDSAPPLTDMVGGGPFSLKPGVWTDDTSMALALAESLAQKGALDPPDVMRRFVGWWRDGAYSPTGECFDIGATTRAALARYERTGDCFSGTDDERSAGNGSLMRLAPVALWGLGQTSMVMRAAARDQSRTTHGARACLDACEAFAVILAETIRGGGLDQGIDAAQTLDLASPIAEIVGGSWQSKARSQIASSGYVAHSLEAALWCVHETDDFGAAVLLAANLGDDADTTAAITGQLAGAVYGLGAIPAPWLEKLAWRERLLRAARALLPG